MGGHKQRYDEIFLLLSKKVEAWLIRLIAILITVLIVLQVLLHIPQVRYYLSEVVRLEGVKVHVFASADNLCYNVVHSQALPAFLLDSLIVLQ